LRQKAGAGQALVDDGDGDVRDSDMVMTLLASILETYVLTHEEAGGFVIELLAHVFSELVTNFMAAGTETFGLGKRVFLANTRQIGGERLAAMPLAFGLVGLVAIAAGLGVGCHRGVRGSRLGVGCHLGAEPGLGG